MDDQREFALDYVAKIEHWRIFYSSNYMSHTKRSQKEATSKFLSAEPHQMSQVRRGAAEKENDTSTSTVVSSFNQIAEFFKMLEKSYQVIQADKLKSL